MACCSVVVAWTGILAAGMAAAAAPIAPGDVALRQDIQLLADHGIINGPVTTWPLDWEPVLADIRSHGESREQPLSVALAFDRVRERAERESRVGDFRVEARLSAAENPAILRSFADTPRESGAAGIGVSWLGDGLNIDLNAEVVRSPDDDQALRADGSVIGVDIGNFTIAASLVDRWWGPGWDGSLIMSSNARPMPALAVDRKLTEPFESRWLSWLGPWDMNLIFGQMESDRVVPETRFFGFRLNFRPFRSLEVGLSRTAQWCGEGRPCDLQGFFDLMVGRDNRGSDGIDEANEPGNQLAGIDVRWSTALFDRPFAIYSQFIGEDEAGGFPSRYLGQAGLETWGIWRTQWSYRLFAELSGTSCDFVKADIFDCAYNHSIYETGYRYRGRAIGHTADNDARLLSAGLMLVSAEGHSWWITARTGELNRGGSPDPRHSLTPTPRDVLSLDIHHTREFRYGIVDAGIGFESGEDALSNVSSTDGRFYVKWRSH